ncbi:TPR repeat protein-like protein [Patellaria atrata CBS 101060]|uniref:Succinate dehydrogenase assembly factor 2, mitochondrial n=1 Tax=Patellaria atrata CBS 101060 TaxID=1346257 RepID=A0A9P4SC94_9PEZI|nr:TPR repeat protein-like protein [Patellaria atrata CBS 101060]
MASVRIALRSSRALCSVSRRPFSTSTRRFKEKEETELNNFEALNKRGNDTTVEYRKHQMEKALNPHMTSSNSTIANEMPSLGEDSPPPELISAVDGKFIPKDSEPENTAKMTGGTQKPNPEGGANAELEVGEIEGGKFKVEPIRRTGEDANTQRARLLYQSRKRGTLESDLLLSTFADTNLAAMNPELLQQYDLFLDENDWDIYYWATQEPPPTSAEYAEGAGPKLATPSAQGKDAPQKDSWASGQPKSGEWAQTVGTFKPAYRPVPSRWKNSQILAMLRQHVKDRSAGGVQEAEVKVEGKSLNQSLQGIGGGGLGRMPDVKNFDT